MAETEIDIDNLEEHQGSYSEAILVKKAILRKMYDIIFWQEKFDEMKLNEIVSPEYFTKWKVNLFSLYRLLEPMMVDKHYKESADKIKPVMDKLILNADVEEVDDQVYYNVTGQEVQHEEKKLDVTELYIVTTDMFHFIKILGITDLEIKKNKGGMSIFEDD